MQLYEPLMRGSKLLCPLRKTEYPFMMRFDEKTSTLLVCTRRFIYLINTAKQDVFGAFVSTSEAISRYSYNIF